MPNSIDSNLTGLAVAEEASLKTLPGSPIWYGLEPNSYSDFGSTIKTEARAPIDPTRQNKKGAVVDVDASAKFNIDHTQNNLTRLLQGFFFADIHQKPATIALDGTFWAISSVTASSKTFGFAATPGIPSSFITNRLILVSNTFFNNGIKTVAGSTTTSVVVGETCFDESPTSAAKIETVGYKFPAGALSCSVVGGLQVLSIPSGSMSNELAGLSAGEWVFFDFDPTNTTAARGYARVLSVSGTTLTFDTTTFTPFTATSSGIFPVIYFSNFIKNESTPSLIKRRSYQIERSLSNDGTSSNNQTEIVIGAVSNELNLKIQQAKKLEVEIGYIGCDKIQRSSTLGPLGGTRVASLGEEALNGTSNVYDMKLSINSNSVSNRNDLFAYVTDVELNIKNNVSADKAVGVLGAFDLSVGNFHVTGKLTAYFTNTTSVDAVRNNADVGFYAIIANKNAGFIYDIPLLGLGNGRLNVVKDKSVDLPLDLMAAQSKFGHTLTYCSFPYLPNAAMPT